MIGSFQTLGRCHPDRRRRPAVRRAAAVVLAAVAAAPASVAGAQTRSPTPLRLVATTAIGLFSDGERYAVVELRGRIDSYDTFTGRRRTVTGSGCSVFNIQFYQTHLAAGHALVGCASGPAIMDLATGSIAPLPPLPADPSFPNPLYTHLGTWWAASYDARCAVGPVLCDFYVNYRTGEQRVFPAVPAGSTREFRDLDDPGLRLRRVCRPHRLSVRAGQRVYEPPYLLVGGGVARCGSRRLGPILPQSIPDRMNLSAGRVSWGDDEADGNGEAYLFDTRTGRLFSWRMPHIGARARRRAPASAVHTRRAIFFAASLRFNVEGEPTVIRVYRARLPPPSRR